MAAKTVETHKGKKQCFAPSIGYTSFGVRVGAIVDYQEIQ